VPWTSEKREASLLDFVCVASCLIDKTFRRNTPAFVFIYLGWPSVRLSVRSLGEPAAGLAASNTMNREQYQ